MAISQVRLRERGVNTVTRFTVMRLSCGHLQLHHSPQCRLQLHLYGDGFHLQRQTVIPIVSFSMWKICLLKLNKKWGKQGCIGYGLLTCFGLCYTSYTDEMAGCDWLDLPSALTSVKHPPPNLRLCIMLPHISTPVLCIVRVVLWLCCERCIHPATLFEYEGLRWSGWSEMNNVSMISLY